MRNLTELDSFLSELNSKFIYTTDKEQYGTYEYWIELDLNREKVKGDCEDYALTIKKEFGGMIYICKYKGSGHAILKLKNGQFVDNIQKRPVDKLDKHYTLVIPFPEPFVLIKKIMSRILKFLF